MMRLLTVYHERVRISAIIFLFCSFSSCLNAQTVSGNNLIWDRAEYGDSRIAIQARTAGLNYGGYESTKMLIKNLTNKKLNIAIRQIFIDFCGVEKERNVTFTLEPNQTIGDIGTGYGYAEYYKFEPVCEIKKKYAEWLSTKISNIKIYLTGIKELEPGPKQNNSGNKEDVSTAGTSYYDVVNNKKNTTDNRSNNNADEDFWGNKKTPDDPSSASQNNFYISDKCTTQRMGIMGNIGADCIPLTFISEKTIQFNSTTSEIRTDNSPDNFILTYKRADDIFWSEKEVAGNQIKYNLSGLDPCTSYEIKIQRNCGGGQRSRATIPIQFTTACPGISLVQPISTTASTAKMNYRTKPNMASCSFQSLNKRVVFVYRNLKTQKSQTVEFATGETPYLVDLMPNTSYAVKGAVIYKNRKYSAYTTPIIIKTKVN